MSPRHSVWSSLSIVVFNSTVVLSWFLHVLTALPCCIVNSQHYRLHRNKGKHFCIFPGAFKIWIGVWHWSISCNSTSVFCEPLKNAQCAWNALGQIMYINVHGCSLLYNLPTVILKHMRFSFRHRHRPSHYCLNRFTFFSVGSSHSFPSPDLFNCQLNCSPSHLHSSVCGCRCIFQHHYSYDFMSVTAAQLRLFLTSTCWCPSAYEPFCYWCTLCWSLCRRSVLAF